MDLEPSRIIGNALSTTSLHYLLDVLQALADAAADREAPPTARRWRAPRRRSMRRSWPTAPRPSSWPS